MYILQDHDWQAASTSQHLLSLHPCNYVRWIMSAHFTEEETEERHELRSCSLKCLCTFHYLKLKNNSIYSFIRFC
jgi:hypothetical protein